MPSPAPRVAPATTTTLPFSRDMIHLRSGFGVRRGDPARASSPHPCSLLVRGRGNSPPVMEPVGVVGDQLGVRGFLLDLDLGERDLDRSLLVQSGADQPVLLVEPNLFRSDEAVDGDTD